MEKQDNNFDYQKIINKNIEFAKILSTVPENNRDKVSKLLLKKEKILNNNCLFAELRLNNINKKIRRYCNEKKEIK